MFLLKKAFNELQGNLMIKNSFIVIALRGLSAVFQFIVVLYITNHFSPELVGKYDLVLSVLNVFGSLCIVGMNHAIIYYSGVFTAKKTTHTLWKVYKKMMVILWIAAIVFFVLFLLTPQNLINSLYQEDVYGFLLKTFAALGFYAVTYLNFDTFRALGRLRLSEIYRSLLRYFFFFGFVLLLHYTNHHERLTDALLFNFLFLAVLSTFFVIREFKNVQNIPFKESEAEAIVRKRDIFFRSYPMSVSMIAFLLLQSTDIILLGMFVEFNEVAYYARAVQLTLLVSMVLHAVNTVYAPKVAELYELNAGEELRLQVKKATRLIFFASLPPMLGLVFLSGFVLSFFGEEYTAASTALVILMVGQIINTLTGSVGMYMNMTNKQQALQAILIITLIVNVILNLLLIPKYGLNGAAIGTAVSTAGWNLYGAVYLYFKEKIKVFLH